MLNNNRAKSLFVLSRTGCLLPFLIFFNLIFGRLFLPPRAWLILEGALILLFLINASLMMRTVKKTFYGSGKRRDVIDVEGEVVKEKNSSVENKELK